MGILVWLVWVFELKSYEGWVPRFFLSPVEMGIWPRKMRISVAKMLLSDGDMTYSNLYKQPTKLILSTRWNKKHEIQWKIQDALGLLPKNWKYTSNLYISILKDWNLGFNPLHGPNPGHMRLLVSKLFLNKTLWSAKKKWKIHTSYPVYTQSPSNISPWSPLSPPLSHCAWREHPVAAAAATAKAMVEGLTKMDLSNQHIGWIGKNMDLTDKNGDVNHLIYHLVI